MAFMCSERQVSHLSLHRWFEYFLEYSAVWMDMNSKNIEGGILLLLLNSMLFDRFFSSTFHETHTATEFENGIFVELRLGLGAIQ